MGYEYSFVTILNLHPGMEDMLRSQRFNCGSSTVMRSESVAKAVGTMLQSYTPAPTRSTFTLAYDHQPADALYFSHGGAAGAFSLSVNFTFYTIYFDETLFQLVFPDISVSKRLFNTVLPVLDLLQMCVSERACHPVHLPERVLRHEQDRLFWAYVHTCRIPTAQIALERRIDVRMDKDCAIRAGYDA